MISAASTFTPGASVRDKVLAALSRGVEAGARIVAEEARNLAPVDTGALRASIEARPAEQDQDVGGSGDARTAIVVATVPYASYVEYGTGQKGESSAGAGPGPYDPNWPGMVAQPFMRSALDGRREDVIDAINAEVRGAF